VNAVGRRSLGRDVADDLRRRILDGELKPGSKLPSEAELGAHYGVSRVTVRAALQLMESRGLADIRHGSGTYVAANGDGIRAGLQELRSITDTIRELGHEPSMRRLSVALRPATAREGARLGIDPGVEVWSIARSIFADEEVVAYSDDVIPTSVVPAPSGGLDPDLERLGQYSVFAELEARGLAPVRAVAEVHAVTAADLPFAADLGDDQLYLLLDQRHETARGRPVLYSRTYFVEGRFQFVILRTR
jgi:GntR family transcriptional regulator